MTERPQTEELDKVMGDILETKLLGGNILIPEKPELIKLPSLLTVLTEDPAEAEELAAQVADLTQRTIKNLRQAQPVEIDLNAPEGIALVMGLGPASLGAVVLPNSDGSETGLYATTTPENSLEKGTMQFTWLGAKNNGKWEAPIQLDPTSKGQSGKDMLTYLSASNQLGVIKPHGSSPVETRDPKHLINQLIKAERSVSSHLADDLEDPEKNQGRRRLLAVTSAPKIIKPGEFGNGLFQDPIYTTRAFGFEEAGFKWVFVPWLMDQNKLHSGSGQLETIKANEANALPALQRMGFASLLNRGTAGNLINNLKETGGLV